MPLLRKLRDPFGSAGAEVATDDWAPVPATATAAPDSWADWLEEPEAPAKEPPRAALSDSGEQATPPPGGFGIQLVGHLDADKRAELKAKPAATSASVNYDKYLTPEERAIIEQQKRVKTAEMPKVKPAPRPRLQPRASAPAMPKKKPLRGRETADNARYHKHLTAEERQILEAQQNGRLRRLTGKTPVRRKKVKTDEIMKDLGSHLTEEERKIIEGQLG